MHSAGGLPLLLCSRSKQNDGNGKGFLEEEAETSKTSLEKKSVKVVHICLFLRASCP